MKHSTTTATRIERWLPVPGYEGSYEISDRGRLRSLKRKNVRKTRTLAGTVMKIGYHSYTLRRDGKSRARYAHRLVLEAFVGPCPVGRETRHLNGNPLDNRLENLKWGPSEENKSDMLRHSNRPIGSRQGSARIDEHQAAQIKARLAAGEGPSSLSRAFGVSYGVVQAILDERTWRHVPWPRGYRRMCRHCGAPWSQGHPCKADGKRLWAR